MIDGINALDAALRPEYTAQGRCHRLVRWNLLKRTPSEPDLPSALICRVLPQCLFPKTGSRVQTAEPKLNEIIYTLEGPVDNVAADWTLNLQSRTRMVAPHPPV